MRMPEPDRVLAQEAEKIRTALESIVHMMQNWSSQPEARMAKALERIADALEVDNAGRRVADALAEVMDQTEKE